MGAGHPRDERRRKTRSLPSSSSSATTPEKSVGVNRWIRVVSSGDLTFPIDEQTTTTVDTTVIENQQGKTMIYPFKDNVNLNNNGHLVCMTTSGFTIALILLLIILLSSCALSAYLCVRLRPFARRIKKAKAAQSNNIVGFNMDNCQSKKTACFYS